VRKWLFTQEYRFRLGQSLLTFVNFSLLVVAASGKLEWVTGLPRTRYLLMVAVPAAMVCVWACGWVMDRVVNAPRIQSRIAEERTPYVAEIIESLKRIENYTGGWGMTTAARKRHLPRAICNICGFSSAISEWRCEIGAGGVVIPTQCPNCKNDEAHADKGDRR